MPVVVPVYVEIAIVSFLHIVFETLLRSRLQTHRRNVAEHMRYESFCLIWKVELL